MQQTRSFWRSDTNSYPRQIRMKIIAYFCFELSRTDCICDSELTRFSYLDLITKPNVHSVPFLSFWLILLPLYIFPHVGVIQYQGFRLGFWGTRQVDESTFPPMWSFETVCSILQFPGFLNRVLNEFFTIKWLPTAWNFFSEASHFHFSFFGVEKICKI